MFCETCPAGPPWGGVYQSLQGMDEEMCSFLGRSGMLVALLTLAPCPWGHSSVEGMGGRGFGPTFQATPQAPLRNASVTEALGDPKIRVKMTSLTR